MAKKWIRIKKRIEKTSSDEDLSHLYDDKEKSDVGGIESGKNIELKYLVEDKVGYMYIPQMNSVSGNIDDDMKKN